MSAMGAAVGAMLGVSMGASMQEGKFIDPMTAFSALTDKLQSDGADLTKVITTMPFLGAVAGGYAGYYRMIPYVRDYV